MVFLWPYIDVVNSNFFLLLPKINQMKKLLLALIICISTTTFSQKQKVTVDDDIIMVDGVAYAKIEKKGAAAPVYTIKSMDGTALMNWQFQDFNDPKEVNNSNT